MEDQGNWKGRKKFSKMFPSSFIPFNYKKPNLTIMITSHICMTCHIFTSFKIIFHLITTVQDRDPKNGKLIGFVFLRNSQKLDVVK
jgi:hypothetical protein